MPIYEYECAQCGRIQEAMQKFSDKPLKKCSQCSGKLYKLISQSSFHLKGSGWYATDYAKRTKDTPTPQKTDQKASNAKTEKSPKASDNTS